MRKKIRYLVEAGLLWAVFLVSRTLPTEKASALGGWIGRTVGPNLAASRKAYKNLELAFPDKTEAEYNTIVKEMWDNLGRVVAEYPHLMDIIQNRCEIVGEENIDAIGENNPCVVIGSHLANWELGPFYFNHRKKWPLTGVYREPNNPYTAKILNDCRHPEESHGAYIPKSHKGVREMVRTLQEGRKLANHIDQKYNQGLAIPFFGRLAMTSAAFAQLADRFDCPILPLQVTRLKGCRFRITLEPGFKVTGMDEEAALIKCNQILERWIMEAPGQWLWLHRRWDSKALSEKAST